MEIKLNVKIIKLEFSEPDEPSQIVLTISTSGKQEWDFDKLKKELLKKGQQGENLEMKIK